MNLRNPVRILLAVAALSLPACGGGGGDTGHVSSVPPPPPPPPPPPVIVNIFPNPVPETYASIGVGLSTADADQPHIRYNSGGFYEIQLPGEAYDKLVPLKGYVPPDPATNSQFQPASTPQNLAYFFTSNSRLSGYRCSEMASWAKSQVGGGYVAFGSVTPPGAVPVIGSATYAGVAEGGSDIVESMGDWGLVAVQVTGTVALSFNFGAGSLDGSMALEVAPSSGNVPVGTFTLKDTVYSVGSATYSGAFNASGVGTNFFFGRFTGPNANETIGAWALPFVFNGQGHQASGVWIAKKGN